MGVGMKAITKRQRALQVGYLCLVEDGSERRGARVSDEVPLETASEGWDGDGERVGVSMGIDTMDRAGGRTIHRYPLALPRIRFVVILSPIAPT